MTSFHDAPDECMEDDEAMEERSTQIYRKSFFNYQFNQLEME